MTRHAEPITRTPGRRMPDEPEQAHEREERVARDLARTIGAVELEGGERLRRARQAEARVAAVDLDPDEGIHERKGAGDVPPRAQRLDEPDLGERCLQLRRAGLPRDAVSRSHQRATLPILLRPARRAVLGQPAPEIAGLADVKQPAGGVVHAIDTRLARNSGKKLCAKLPVERPHAPLSQRRAPIDEAFVAARPPARAGLVYRAHRAGSGLAGAQSSRFSSAMGLRAVMLKRPS